MQQRRPKLGEVLLRSGAIDEVQLKEALRLQEQWGGKLGEILVEKGALPENTLVRVLSRLLGYPAAELDAVESIDRHVLERVDVEYAERHKLMPYRFRNPNTLLVAMADPANVKVVSDLEFRTGCRIEVSIAGETEIHRALSKHYHSVAQASGPWDDEEYQMIDALGRPVRRGPPEGEAEEADRAAAKDAAEDKAPPSQVLRRPMQRPAEEASPPEDKAPPSQTLRRPAPRPADDLAEDKAPSTQTLRRMTPQRLPASELRPVAASPGARAATAPVTSVPSGVADELKMILAGFEDEQRAHREALEALVGLLTDIGLISREAYDAKLQAVRATRAAGGSRRERAEPGGEPREQDEDGEEMTQPFPVG
jgi:hypothetical protein